MPVDLTRDNVESRLNRLGYGKGLDIKTDVAGFLAEQPYAFKSDTIVARIDTATNAVEVEAVLSHHPDVFSYSKEDDGIYWYVDDKNLEQALEVAEE